MAYNVYTVYAESKPNPGYGASLKNYVEALEDAVPCLSFDRIISDTTSSYEAFLNISFTGELQLHFKSANSYVITAEVTNAANDNNVTSLGYSTQGGVYMHWIETTGMLFYTTGTSALFAGELTSQKDGSRVAVAGSGTSYYSVINGTKYTSTISAYSPGSAFAATLEPNQYCIAEGFYIPGANFSVALPYTLNGSGPYSMVGSHSISNGALFDGSTISLLRVNGSCNWRL